MGWSYSQNPSANSKDAVRFLTGQTSSSHDEIVQDEEIAYTLTLHPNVRFASAVVLESLAGKYAIRATQKSVGELSIGYGRRAEELRLQAKELRRGASLRVSPFAGGITVSDKNTQEEDTDRVAPSFAVGMDDYSASSTSST